MKINFRLSSVIIILLFAVLLGFIVGYYFSCQVASIDLSNLNNQLCQVVKVIDGDTIKVKIGNKIETVRLLGINTPEIENSYRHQECFGLQAKKEAKKLLTGKKIYILSDPNAPNRGEYNRLLRYVFLLDGEFVNAKLIKEGYAFSYIYQPIRFMDYFNLLEKDARNNRIGVWSNKCDYYSKFKNGK